MATNTKDIRGFTLSYFRAKLPDFDLTKRIRDLRIDSLDLVEFLMAVEEKFELEIDADEIDQDMTLEQFCKLAERQG
jgi:acyl carrier protein